MQVDVAAARGTKRTEGVHCRRAAGRASGGLLSLCVTHVVLSHALILAQRLARASRLLRAD